MDPVQFPQIITFYSYKGGVGRSMALMNAAYTLAGWGRHVLMIDMDLEAPGISGFLKRSEELDTPAPLAKDVFTLLGEVKRLAATGGKPEELARDIAPLSNFIRSVKRDKLAALKPEMGQLGRLDMLGPDQSYHDRYAKLGLQGSSQNELVAMSRVLHFYLKAQTFPFQPDWAKEFQPAQPTHYDYILVDSRTGITEIGGLCVGPLSEKLVVVTGLNDQNIQGTREFLALTGLIAGPVRTEERNIQPDDESAATILGPKPTILVASPVPSGELRYRTERLVALERELGAKPLRISYHPQLALMETVFVRDYPDEYLAIEYRNLASRILSMSGDSTAALAKMTPESMKTAGGALAAMRLIERIAPRDPSVAAAWLSNLASQREGKVRTSDWPLLNKIWALLALWKPMRSFALGNWGNALSDQAKSKSGAEADDLFALSYEKYQEAVRLQPDDAQAWSDWGGALIIHSYATPPDKANHLLAQARHCLENGARLDPKLASYNMACLEAIENNLSEALRWLEMSKQFGKVRSKSQLAAERDFDNIRETPEFLLFVTGLPDH